MEIGRKKEKSLLIYHPQDTIRIKTAPPFVFPLSDAKYLRLIVTGLGESPTSST